jgi:dihydrodipicolinate synthase/N-acetylneuraminate lyase
VPEQVVELLTEHENLHAIKESSADVRRVAALELYVWFLPLLRMDTPLKKRAPA